MLKTLNIINHKSMGIIDTFASLGVVVLVILGNLGIFTLLDRLGFGASKRVGFFLPSINIDQVKILLGHFSAKQGWRLIKEENQEAAVIIIFQVGQWGGLSISGSQRVYIALNQEQTGVRGIATSKSAMGQLVDWEFNQKNLDNLVAFLEKAISQPNQLGNLLSQSVSFAKAKSTINPKFFGFLGLLILGLFIFKFIFNSFIASYSSIKPHTNDNVVSNKNSLPTVPANTTMALQDDNPNNWKKASWMSFVFSYPNDFVLTEGGFDDNFFYLDLKQQITENEFLRIYGISEDWKGVDLKEVVKKRKDSYIESFPGYSLIKESQSNERVTILEYSWVLGSDKIKTYEIIKEFNGIARFFRIAASAKLWDENAQIFEGLIQGIKYD